MPVPCWTFRNGPCEGSCPDLFFIARLWISLSTKWYDALPIDNGRLGLRITKIVFAHWWNVLLSPVRHLLQVAEDLHDMTLPRILQAWFTWITLVCQWISVYYSTHCSLWWRSSNSFSALSPVALNLMAKLSVCLNISSIMVNRWSKKY